MASKLESKIQAYAEWAVDNKKRMFLIVFAIIGLLGSGAQKLKFDTTFRIWHPQGSKNVKDYDELVAKFGSDDVAIAVWKSPDDRIFTNDLLASVRRLTDQLLTIESVRRVDSLANFSMIKGSRLEHETPAFAVTDKYVIAVGDQSEVLLWDTQTWEKTVLQGHEGGVERMLTTRDNRYLVTGGIDRSVIIWDLETSKLVRRIRGIPNEVSALALSSDESKILVGSFGATLVFDRTTGAQLAKWDTKGDFVVSILTAPDGRRVYVGSEDIQVWDVNTNKQEATYKGHSRFIADMILSSDGAHLYSTADDGLVLRWNTADGTNSPLVNSSELGLSLALTDNDKLLVVGMTDGSIRTIAVAVKKVAPVVSRIHNDWVVDLTVDSTGRVYSASRDHNVAMHVPGQGPQILLLAAHRASVRRVLVDPTGKRIYTLGDDGDLYAWSSDSHQMLARLPRDSKSKTELEEAIAVEGENTGRIGVYNGFRFPIEVRVPGRTLGRIEGHKRAEFDGLAVPPKTPCEGDDSCGGGQYCDWEQDEPVCVARTQISAFVPNSDILVWQGEAFITNESIGRISVPSEEPFSVAETAEAPFPSRGNLSNFRKEFSGKVTATALEKVLGKDANNGETFLSPAVAGQLAEAIDSSTEEGKVARKALTTLEQAKMSPLQLPLQPYRLREAIYHLMRPPNPAALGVVANEARDTTMIAVSVHQADYHDALGNSFRVREGVKKRLDTEAGRTGYSFHLTGDVVQDTTMAEYAEKDLHWLLPLFFGTIALLLLVIYRRPSGVVIPLGMVGISIAGTMGTSAHLGAALNNMTVAVPQVVLASCIGDAVHIFNTYVHNLRGGQDTRTASVNAIVPNFVPCFWTTVSTSIGFFSLSTSNILPVGTFGWMAGIGVIAAFTVSFTIMPGLMSILPVPKSLREPANDSEEVRGFDAWVDRRIDSLADYVNRTTGTIVVLAVLCTGVGVYGSTKIVFDTNSIKFFSEDAPFRKACNFIEENISGPLGVSLIVDTGEEGGIRKREHLEKLAKIQDYIKESDAVQSVVSLSDILKGMNRVMNEDLDDNYRIPDTDERTSSYYNAYTFSLRAGMELTNRVSADESSTLLDVRMKNKSSVFVIEWGRDLYEWMEKNVPGATLTITAKSWLYSNMLKEVSKGFFENVGSAVLLISFIVFFLARSFPVGFVASLANVVPLVMTVGVLSLQGQTLDISVMVSCCVAMGVIVDDTIHFVAKYKRLRGKGQDHDTAIIGTLQEAGRAMIYTTIILVTGFSLFLLTDYQINANFGMTVAIMLTVGMIFDLTALPAGIKMMLAITGKDNLSEKA